MQCIDLNNALFKSLVQAPAVVQRPETFVVISGRKDGNNDEFTDAVYEFDQVSYAWTKLPQTVGRPRCWSVAIPLPDDWEDVCV